MRKIFFLISVALLALTLVTVSYSQLHLGIIRGIIKKTQELRDKRTPTAVPDDDAELTL